MEPSSPAVAHDAFRRIDRAPVDQLGHKLVWCGCAVGKLDERGVRVDGFGVGDVHVWDDLREEQ